MNASGQLWLLNDINRNLNNWQNDFFCMNRHPMLAGNRYVNNVHEEGEHSGPEVRGITCHVVVPHGAKQSRLIGHTTDAAPYNYLGIGAYDTLVIDGFSKSPDPTNYRINICTMTGVCHAAHVGIYED